MDEEVVRRHRHLHIVFNRDRHSQKHTDFYQMPQIHRQHFSLSDRTDAERVRPGHAPRARVRPPPDHRCRCRRLRPRLGDLLARQRGSGRIIQAPRSRSVGRRRRLLLQADGTRQSPIRSGRNDRFGVVRKTGILRRQRHRLPRSPIAWVVAGCEGEKKNRYPYVDIAPCGIADWYRKYTGGQELKSPPAVFPLTRRPLGPNLTVPAPCDTIGYLTVLYGKRVDIECTSRPVNHSTWLRLPVYIVPCAILRATYPFVQRHVVYTSSREQMENGKNRREVIELLILGDVQLNRFVPYPSECNQKLGLRYVDAGH